MDALSAAIELGVGLGCLAIGWTMRGRSPWFTVAGVVLAGAGAVAVVHAVWSLTRGS